MKQREHARRREVVVADATAGFVALAVGCCRRHGVERVVEFKDASEASVMARDQINGAEPQLRRRLPRARHMGLPLERPHRQEIQIDPRRAAKHVPRERRIRAGDCRQRRWRGEELRVMQVGNQTRDTLGRHPV